MQESPSQSSFSGGVCSIKVRLDSLGNEFLSYSLDTINDEKLRKLPLK